LVVQRHRHLCAPRTRPAHPPRHRFVAIQLANGVESRPVSLEALIAKPLICGVIVALIGYDRGRGLWEVFLLLTRLDEMVIGALIRLWRSS
jgi:hypothetical protein